MIEGTKLTYSDFVSFAEAQELDSEQSDESETEEEISFVIQKPSSKNRRKIISDDELSNDESEEFDSNGTFLVDFPQFTTHSASFRLLYFDSSCNTVVGPKNGH